jgi:hypothetical protein
MKIITPGHRYELENFEHKDTVGQVLQFIEKQYANDSAGTLITRLDGTTNEEVLAMLIDRLKFLGGRLSCRENAIALTHIETALLWLNHRTSERKARNVEGTSNP